MQLLKFESAILKTIKTILSQCSHSFIFTILTSSESRDVISRKLEKKEGFLTKSFLSVSLKKFPLGYVENTCRGSSEIIRTLPVMHSIIPSGLRRWIYSDILPAISSGIPLEISFGIPLRITSWIPSEISPAIHPVLSSGKQPEIYQNILWTISPGTLPSFSEIPWKKSSGKLSRSYPRTLSFVSLHFFKQFELKCL